MLHHAIIISYISYYAANVIFYCITWKKCLFLLFMPLLAVEYMLGVYKERIHGHTSISHVKIKNKKAKLFTERLMMIQKKISYKDTYYNLVKRENLEGIKRIIKDHGYYDSTSIEKIQYRELKGLPHFFLTVDSPNYTNGHYAVLDGIYLNVNSIIPLWIGKFYLSIVIIRKPTNAKIRPFIAPVTDIEHELNHLHRLIDYINKYPDYIDKSIKYNVGFCEVCNLDESIKFEVKKIFSMEIPTLILDFDIGQKDLFSYDKGTVTKITVNNKDDFLRYKVGQYLSELNNHYIKRFPENMQQIKNNIEKEVNRQGKILFGDNCMMLFLISLIKYFSILETKGVCYEVGDI